MVNARRVNCPPDVHGSGRACQRTNLPTCSFKVLVSFELKMTRISKATAAKLLSLTCRRLCVYFSHLQFANASATSATFTGSNIHIVTTESRHASSHWRVVCASNVTTTYAFTNASTT
jgi:hypothetical protein